LQGGFVQVGKHNPRTFLVKSLGKGLADSARRTRNNCDFSY
jgi:hypothetical protein